MSLKDVKWQAFKSKFSVQVSKYISGIENFESGMIPLYLIEVLSPSLLGCVINCN